MHKRCKSGRISIPPFEAAAPACLGPLAAAEYLPCFQLEQASVALGALHQAEIEKWWPIIKAANIKAE
jgi:hypothetical protein